jgi:penicillin-binding protein 1B
MQPVDFTGGLLSPGEVLTTVSTVDDVPTTFWFDEKPYEPANFSNKIYGLTTLRNAMRNSMNIATVKVAELVGYQRVAELARRAGLGAEIQATPAIALGAYEVTPLDIAAAYTVFVQGGKRLAPYFIRSVRDAQGRILLRNQPREEEVLDPRVAYVITDILQDVINRGTAVRVRGMGLNVPAAGKTGTDDDGWFAGFTSNLICVVWVGFDDNTDLKMQGAHSALPIWTEFMKRAHDLREYRNPAPFEAPDGVITMMIDADTHQPATFACPNQESEVFIAGSEPIGYCQIHGGGRLLATNVAGWDSGNGKTDPEEPSAKVIDLGERPPRTASTQAGSGESREEPQPPEPRRKKGFFGRILDVFR